MTRRLLSISALASILLAGLPASPALAIDEADRLWLVGERSFADGLHPIARRVLERFVIEYPSDSRLPSAMLLLGRSRLALGDSDKALDAFRRLRAVATLPAQQLEGRFWEAEALYRLKQFAAARSGYDDVISKDAASPLASEALYGLALCDLELRRPEPAVKAFRDLLAAWPEHTQAPSATFYLAQTLVDLKRYPEALPLLAAFPTKYPKHKLLPDAQYLLGSTRLAMGERDAGLADLQAFVAAYPSHPMAATARRTITGTVAKSGSPSQQKSAYTQLMQQPSATPDALYDAGALAGKLGNVKDQQTAWARLRKEFPSHPLASQAALDLAETAFKRKDWKEAAALAKAAAATSEESLRARALLLEGESELKLSRFRDAAKSFEAVGGMKNLEAPDQYRALAGLGLAREQLGEVRAALAAYDAVASKSPDTTLRDWARGRAAAIRAQGQPSKPATGGEKRS
ncbi:MAG TPA: tetratricopeptide repeat protein [Candidatus Binatia bacterium]|nr:tetratricopeptide repeat protein [Candidatus Binatia bacterium]